MLSAFGSLLCVETDADQHLAYCCVWGQMVSAFGLLLCVETDGVSIWFIAVCRDRWCQHLVYCCVWSTDGVSIWFHCCVWRQMRVSIWLIVVCGDRCCQHLVYCCVWRQMVSAFGLLLCVETDGVSICFIVV